MLRILSPLPPLPHRPESPGVPAGNCVCNTARTLERKEQERKPDNCNTHPHTHTHTHTSAHVQVLTYQPDCSIKTTKCGAQEEQQATREGRAPTAIDESVEDMPPEEEVARIQSYGRTTRRVLRRAPRRTTAKEPPPRTAVNSPTHKLSEK